MKIAMIYDGLQTGGIERVGADYAKIFIQFGWDVTIINLRPKLGEMADEFPAECHMSHTSFPRRFAPEQYTQLIKKNYICKIAYPIAYTALSIANTAYRILCRMNPALKEKYDIAIAFSGHFNDLTYIASDFVKAEKKMCWLHGALYGYLLASDGYLNLYKKIKNLVVLVDDAQEEVFFYNKGLHLNIQKLYNPTFIKNRPINPDMVNELRNKYGRFLLMVSRFDYPHKDHYTVVKALQIFRERYQQDLKLLLVGTGPEEEKVKNYVRSLGTDIKERVHFMGLQTEIQNFYKAAYLLVHASVAGEGLPTVMLEAMAYGLPMVVTDSKVGPREILKDNEYGLLCRIQDPEDMAAKIYQLYTDDKLYHLYQQRSRQRIKDFEPEAIQEKLSVIIESLVK